MGNCLMIGNGLNRCLENSISWDSLLQEVADELGVSYNSSISMPLEYERIINSYLKTATRKKDSIYLKTKTSIASRLSEVSLPENSIHKRISEINVDSILTTNYDCLLEYVYNPGYKDKGTKHKYLPDATSIQNGICFYHPHGIVSRKKSLCLGYEHYMGIVENLRSELNKKKEHKKEKMAIKQRLYGELEFENTWYEKFYTSNIAIIGFGLTECEVDIWWILTHRAFLYYSNYCGLKDKIMNRIIYYDIIDDIPKKEQEKEKERENNILSQYNRHTLLENDHVDVKKYNLSAHGGTYAEAYDSIITNIKNNGI